MEPSWSESSLVQPLSRAQNYLLQVLMTRFRLARQGNGVKLRVDFNRDTSTIWNRQAKDEIRTRIADFEQKERYYQGKLNDILLRGSEDLKPFDPFDDVSFPFRYISGGTLPIVHIGSDRYYCLFYREVYPIGWNIANGAADNFHELLDPMDVVKRELGEELLIVNPVDKQRYVFAWDTSELVDWPGFTVARRLFQSQYPDLNLGACDGLCTKPDWLDGPDSLWVSFEDGEPHVITDCFVNINATDFGIEVDRVANITVDEKAIIFDGEITSDVPVGAPIGLFPVGELNSIVDRANAASDSSGKPAHTRTAVLPQRFFYEARPYDAAKVHQLRDWVPERYIPRLRRAQVLSEDEVSTWNQAADDGQAHVLCPVTHALISRLLRHEREQSRRPTIEGTFDFFLSYATLDATYARSVYQHLTHEKKLRVFFDKATPMRPQFSEEIRQAIHNSRGMIVVATRPEHLRHEGVIIEWTTFLNAVAEGRKPKTSSFINFVSGFGYDALPALLSLYHIVPFSQTDIGPGLTELGDFIERIP